jgi:hypothetical protein
MCFEINTPCSLGFIFQFTQGALSIMSEVDETQFNDILSLLSDESQPFENIGDISDAETSRGAQGTQGRRWCFTINNYTQEDLDYLGGLFELESSVRFLLFQCEIGEAGTCHVQGYIELKKQWRFTRVKRLIQPGGHPHVEMARGNADQNRAYCTKEEGRIDGPFEFGSPALVARVDLMQVKQMIDDGISEKDLWNAGFSAMVRYYRAFNHYRMIIAAPRDFKTEFIYVFGSPGTGKSRWVMDNYPAAFWKQRSGWWCGYHGEDTVVLDDFYGWLPYDLVLRMADRYPLTVETKGGQVNFAPKQLIITSNNAPANLYKNVENLEALIRRIDKFVFFSNEKEEFTDYGEFLVAIGN